MTVDVCQTTPQYVAATYSLVFYVLFVHVQLALQALRFSLLLLYSTSGNSSLITNKIKQNKTLVGLALLTALAGVVPTVPKIIKPYKI